MRPIYMALVNFIIIMLLPFIPIKRFYYKERLQLGVMLMQICVSPFGKVSFSHFVLADILTSLVKPILDVPQSVCFFCWGFYIYQEDTECGWF